MLTRYRYVLVGPFRACWEAPLAVQFRNYTRGMRVSGRPRNKKSVMEDEFVKMEQDLRLYKIKRHDKITIKSQEQQLKELDVPYHISSINQLLSKVVPLEPFAKAPMYSRLGLMQRLAESKDVFPRLYAKYQIMWKLRKIDPFREKEFAVKAQDIFIEANRAQQKEDYDALKKLVSVNAHQMIKSKQSNVLWEFVEQLEPPRVVNTRASIFSTSDNIFAQVTVRMKLRQIFAEYGRLNKLVKGDPKKPEDVIAYVVFERPLKDAVNTSWKVCGKLPSQVPWQEVDKELAEKRREAKLKNYKTKADRDRIQQEFQERKKLSANS